MSEKDELRIEPEKLVQAWQETLPEVMNRPDRSVVAMDEADPRSLRITIYSAGHQMYAFDFKVTYVDSREVKVELIDVEKNDRTIDERNDMIQQLIEDYTRHLHECAQALHRLTHV